MKRNLNKKTLTVALLLAIVAIGTMDAFVARQYPIRKPIFKQNVNVTLFQAVLKGDTRRITDLIKKEGANINARSKEGTTPLITAAKLSADNPKMASVVKTLLRDGANASEQDPSGMTALMWAAQGGDNNTVKALLQNKKAQKTVDMKDKKGNDALDYASQKGNTKITKLLLRYKAIPTRMTILKARTQEVKDTLQKKFNELKKAGKLPIQLTKPSTFFRARPKAPIFQK